LISITKATTRKSALRLPDGLRSCKRATTASRFKPRWSGSGLTAVTNGEYRFVSPVWFKEDCEDLGGDRMRPLKLSDAGLTNQPNLRGLVPC